MRRPEIVDLHSLLTNGAEAGWPMPDGHIWYGPARAYGFNNLNPFGRFKAAWMVFTGRADALTWPDSGSPQ